MKTLIRFPLELVASIIGVAIILAYTRPLLAVAIATAIAAAVVFAS